MPHKLRKTRKNRGSRTQGYGRVGQHRDQGSKGYRKSGRHKRGWSWVQRYDPDYFGKDGFTSPKSLRKHGKTINLGRLDEVADKIAVETENAKFFVDLESFGVTKLLGKGKLTKPLTVKVASCSKSAADKIKDAGGQILMETQEQGE